MSLSEILPISVLQISICADMSFEGFLLRFHAHVKSSARVLHGHLTMIMSVPQPVKKVISSSASCHFVFAW